MINILAAIIYALLVCAAGAQSFPGKLPAGSILANPQNTPSRAVPSKRGSIVATDYGFAANNGHDNSGDLQTLYNAMGGSSTAWNSYGLYGYDVTFPALLGTPKSEYYFSGALSYTRAGALICDNGENYLTRDNVMLVFAPGVDGVIQDLVDPTGGDTSLGWGAFNLKGCAIRSLGKWLGSATSGSGVISSLTNYSATQYYSDTQGWRVDDGVILTNGAWGTPVIATNTTGTKVGSVGAGPSITLAGGVTANTTHAVYAYRLPKELAYAATYLINSAEVTLASGPARMLQPGDMIWTDKAPFGTIITQTSGNAYPQTIWMGQIDHRREQRSSATGTGSLWLIPAGHKRRNSSRAENDFVNHFPVGQQMTCSSGFRVGAATTWTYEAWTANTVYLVNQEVTNDSGKTYVATSASGTSAGSGGPTGTGTGIVDGTVTWNYVGPTTGGSGASGQNCTASEDRDVHAWGALIGRYTAGNNTAPSTSYNQDFHDNYGADLAELASLGSTYVGATLHSREQSTGRDYGFLWNCYNQNQTIFVGGYMTTNFTTDGSCVDPANPFVNTPIASGANGPLFIQPTAFFPKDAFVINNGQIKSDSPGNIGWTFAGNTGTNPFIILKPRATSFFDLYYSSADVSEVSLGYDSTDKIYAWRWPGTPARVYFGFSKWDWAGYTGDGWGYPLALKGMLLSDANKFSTSARLLSATNTLQTDSYRKQGDVQIKTDAVAGGYAGWYGTVDGGTFRPFAPISLDTSGYNWNLPAITHSAPRTVTGATDSIGAIDYSVIYNASGTCTVTLPAAASFSGRVLHIKTIAAQTVVSASSNVVPLVGGAAGTDILAATAGKWAELQSDGTNWQIMQGN